jgi:hypothetical protein
MIPTPKGQTPPAPGLDREEPEFAPDEPDIPTSADERRGTAPDSEPSEKPSAPGTAGSENGRT